jgi:hypothetical protein
MKKLFATALAGIIATTTLVGVADAAPWNKNWDGNQNGNWKYGNHQMHRGPGPWAGNYGRSYDPGPAIIAGTIFGAIGALALNSGGANYGYAGPQSHVAWCDWRYQTYNPATNTYFIRPGVPAACHSPYAY